MSAGEELLRAIAESPEDDDRRLVYADWLEEHGDGERAEFVRASVEAAKEPAFRWDTPAMQRRDEIWRRNEDRWRAELPAWARPMARWERGVPHFVRCSALNFLKHAGGLFRRFPTVRSFEFSN